MTLPSEQQAREVLASAFGSKASTAPDRIRAGSKYVKIPVNTALRAMLAFVEVARSTGEGSDVVAWCAPGQLANLTDVDADGGVYLPIRKTERGNFTMPLYSAPSCKVGEGAGHLAAVDDGMGNDWFGDQDRARASAAADEARYLIRKGGVFYRPNAHGYTASKADAGRYTLAEAIAHSHPNGPDGPRDGIDYMLVDEPAAAPVPCETGEDVRDILNTAQADCGCRIPSPFDEVAEHAVGLALAAATPGNGAGIQKPRPFHEWHEDKGPVLWWLWPITEEPYVGTPLDLGRTVSFDVSVQVGVDLYEVKPTSVGMTGGWPWQGADDGTEVRLFWTELPCAGALDTAIRDHIRGYPEDAA